MKKGKKFAFARMYQAISEVFNVPTSLQCHNISKEKTMIEVTYSRTFAENEFIGNYKKFYLRSSDDQITEIPNTIELKAATEIYSPSNKVKVVFKENSMAVIQGNDILFTSTTKDCGLFSPGGVAWSKDESMFVYCAVSKKKPQKTIFEVTEEDKDFDFMKNFAFEDDLGETHEGTKNVILTIVDLKERKTKKLDLGNIIATNPIVLGSCIYYIGYQFQPHDILGFNYCSNKPYRLYMYDLEKEKNELILTDEFVYKAVANEEGNELVYFSTKEIMKPHLFECDIKLLKLEQRESEIIVPIQNILDANLQYAGFYTLELFYPSILLKGKTLYFSSLYKGCPHYYSINIDTKEIKKLTPSNSNLEHYNFLSYNQAKNEIYFSFTSLNSLPKIGILSLNNNKLSFIEKSTEESPYKNLSNILKRTKEYSIELESGSNSILIDMPEEYNFNEDPDVSEFLDFFKIDKSELEHNLKAKTLIHDYHGGPHAFSSTGQLEIMSLFLGYSLASPNYCGTLGFGQKLLTSSLGNMKEYEETKELTLKAVEKLNIQPKRSMTIGGSYGGYMVYLMNSSPELEKYLGSSVAINGVCDNYAMYTMTDIRNFILGEQLNQNYDYTLKEEDLEKLFHSSPFSKEPLGPLLLILGGKDRRCPYPQNLTYFKDWKNRGKDVNCYFYPESGHSLSLNQNIKYDIATKVFLFFEEKLKETENK